MTKSAFEEAATDSSRNSYFDQQANAWSHRYSSSRHFQERLAIALSWLPRQSPPLSLVDYGCGSGTLIRKLLERGHAVTGIDASDKMLQEARRNLATEKSFAGQFSLIQAESFEMPDKERSWDGIFCLGVIEYIDNPLVLLAQFAESLRPGGFLVISYPNNASLLRRFERVVFRNPNAFKALGLFPHLTGADSYLRFQKHQFRASSLEARVKDFGFILRAQIFHVSPAWLRTAASKSSVGMTAMSMYERTRQ